MILENLINVQVIFFKSSIKFFNVKNNGKLLSDEY